MSDCLSNLPEKKNEKKGKKIIHVFPHTHEGIKGNISYILMIQIKIFLLCQL